MTTENEDKATYKMDGGADKQTKKHVNKETCLRSGVKEMTVKRRWDGYHRVHVKVEAPASKTALGIILLEKNNNGSG